MKLTGTRYPRTLSGSLRLAICIILEGLSSGSLNKGDSWYLVCLWVRCIPTILCSIVVGGLKFSDISDLWDTSTHSVISVIGSKVEEEEQMECVADCKTILGIFGSDNFSDFSLIFEVFLTIGGLEFVGGGAECNLQGGGVACRMGGGAVFTTVVNISFTCVVFLLVYFSGDFESTLSLDISE